MRIINNNYHVAWKHFYPEGNGEPKKGYVLHHIDTTLRNNDKERYLEWRIEDLVMMTKKEHCSYHMRNLSKESKQKKSCSLKGRIMSEVTRTKISKSRTGMIFTKEHNDNLALAHGGRPFYSLNIETGEKRYWLNQQECAKFIGCHGETVRLALKLNRMIFKKYRLAFSE